MSKLSFIERGSKENASKSSTSFKNKYTYGASLPEQNSFPSEKALFDSRVISQQNSPSSISKIRSKIKPLTPQTTSSIN